MSKQDALRRLAVAAEELGCEWIHLPIHAGVEVIRETPGSEGYTSLYGPGELGSRHPEPCAIDSAEAYIAGVWIRGQSDPRPCTGEELRRIEARKGATA